jgi:DNA-binding CsgD family transcriptional regulator
MIERLIDAIYAAVGVPDAWPDILGGFAELTHSDSSLLLVQDVATGQSRLNISSGIDLEIGARYESEHAAGPMFGRLLAAPAGGMIMPDTLMSHEELERTALYREILEPLNIYHSAGAIVLRDDAALGFLLVFRSRAAGAFSQTEHADLARLAPHISRAMQLHYRLITAEINQSLSTAALDRLGYGVVLADQNAHVVFANAAARAAIASERNLKLDGERLSARLRADARKLHAAIASAANSVEASASLRLGDDGEAVWITASHFTLRAAPVPAASLAFICISDPGTEIRASADTLRGLFGLTRAEANMLVALLEGDSLEAAAEHLGIKMTTVKTHLRSLFAKTATTRQADMLLLALRALGPFGVIG